MDTTTTVNNFAQTSLMEPLAKPAPVIYSDYCDNLDSRLYELAERLVAMVDEEDYSDSEEDYEEDLSEEMDFASFPCEEVEDERLLLSDSYTQCMEEALRFLIHEEGFPQNHEMVVGLQRHLEAQKTTAVERAAVKTQTKSDRQSDRLLLRGPAI